MTGASKIKHVALNGISEIQIITYLEARPYIHLVGQKLTGLRQK